MILYNDSSPHCAQWLRNLIQSQLLPPGHVDERPIQDIKPHELIQYTQCHFFAGIGGWSLALALAGIPIDRPLWTGSCPCQPFSQAGQSRGFADERHLWPSWFHLISVCRPPVIFGEQVASRDGLAWLDFVSTDLESADYAVGAADICAAGVGAPHIRQRLWFVAKSDGGDACSEREQRGGEQRQQPQDGRAVPLAHADQGRSGRNAGAVPGAQGSAEGEMRRVADGTEFGGEACGVAYAEQRRPSSGRQRSAGAPASVAPENGGPSVLVNAASKQVGLPGRARQPGSIPWDDCDWLPCTDGKARPVEPGTFPLVDGSAFKLGSGSALEGKSRVGMLRAYGNAIVPQTAAAFIGAAMEAIYAAAP